ncbi:MAG: LysR family transcriptional regulator [Cellvibrionaceae bacterium]
MLQAFDLNLLKTFDSLMESRNVSKTARSLSLTQPAVSNALSRLRKQLDDPLLVRTKHGMEPTPKALSLRQPIKDALRQLEVALLPTEDFDYGASERRFTIAAPDFIGVSLLSQLLPRWQARAPGLSLRIKHLSPETPSEQLEGGDLDLAIGRFFEMPARLNRKALQRDRLVCLVSAGHAHDRASISLDEFLALKHVWVSNSERRGMVDRWLEQRGKVRDLTAITSNYAAGAMLVAKSDYALVVASCYGRQFAEQLSLRCVELEFDPGGFSIDMLWHPFRESDQGHRWLRQEILTCDEFK